MTRYAPELTRTTLGVQQSFTAGIVAITHDVLEDDGEGET